MNRLLVIGIDSLDPELLAQFDDDLPNFARLRKSSPHILLNSIFPVDSIPAWATIFTGLNPAQHGLIYSFDVFRSTWDSILSIDPKVYWGRTFWETAQQAGKKTCVVFPHGIYPPWPTGGVMVCRSFDGRIASTPASVLEGVDTTDLIEPAGENPGRGGLRIFADRQRRATERISDFGLNLAGQVDWDLFFIFIGSLDSIQHLFWRYFDEADPTFPGHTEFQHVILDFYKLIDSLLGEFLRKFPDAMVVVLSDHGHGMRPPRTLNINESLRQEGFLVTKGSNGNPTPFILESFKRLTLDLVHRAELDHVMLRLSKLPLLSSLSKNIYMSKGSIDKRRSLAYLSSFAGPKSYPHGGIEINHRLVEVDAVEYEPLRARVIELLTRLTDPSSGESLVRWACRREDLYSGDHLGLYPDVLFELKEGFGVYWGIHTPLIGRAYEHNLASGGHKKEAVFMVHGMPEGAAVAQQMTLMDIAPTILSMLDIQAGSSMGCAPGAASGQQ